jgi:hypothetical protein
VARPVGDVDAGAAQLEAAAAALDHLAGLEPALGDAGDADPRQGAVVEQRPALAHEPLDGLEDLEVDEAIVLDQDVVGPVAELEIAERRRLALVVARDDEHAVLEAAIEDVLADRMAEPVGDGAELGRRDLEIAGLEPDQILLGDPGTEPVGDQALFDLDLGAVGERGDHLDRVVLPLGPVAHLLGRWIAVQEGFHVAVDERREAGRDCVLGERRKAARLVALGLAEQAALDVVRADRGMEFGVKGHDRLAGVEHPRDGTSRVEGIAGAFEDHVAGGDHGIERIGQRVWAREVRAAVERPPGQHLRQPVAGPALQLVGEVAGDEAGADHADVDLGLFGHSVRLSELRGRRGSWRWA